MPYQSITLAQLRTRLQARWDGQPYWTADEADRAINESLLTWNMLTGRWHQRIVLPTTANTYELALPASLLYRTRIAWNGYPLSPSSREDLTNGRPNWRRETIGSGGDVPTKPTLWAPVSLRLLYLWPMDTADGNSLTLDGVAKTPVLTSDAAYVDLAEADVSCLLGFALHVAAFKQGGPWWTATWPFFKAFLQAAGEENALLTTAQAYRQVMGLDHRDLKPLRDAASTLASSVVPAVLAELPS